MKPRSISQSDELSPESIIEWCNNYQQYHHYNQQSQISIRPSTRFSIGIYQLYQAIEWEGTPNEYEGLAAASIHFICCAEGMGLNTHINELCSRWDFGIDKDWKNIMRLVGGAQQQIVYSELSKSTDRSKSRADLDKLGTFIGKLAKDCLSMIPKMYLAQAVEDATDIMTGRL